MIVLASKSQRRIEIFKKLGFDFKIVPAEIDENIQIENPLFLPAKLAELKAEFIGKSYPECLTVGADTLVFLGNKVLGKPKDLDEAFDYLKILSGKWHSVISGVCILKFSTGKKFVFSEESKVKFRELDDKIITKYFNFVNPLDKAGGYAIQEYGDLIVEKIEGTMENIIGFPTSKFLKVLDIIKDSSEEV